MKIKLLFILSAFCGSIPAQTSIPLPSRIVVQVTPNPSTPLYISNEEIYSRLPNGEPDIVYLNVPDGAGVFLPNGLSDYSYDTNGDNYLIEQKLWDAGTQTYIINSRINKMFVNHQVSEILDERLNPVTNQWETTQTSLMTYSSNGQILTEQSLYYTNGTVYYGYSSSYSYDANGRILELITAGYSGGNFIPEIRQVYQYNDPDDKTDQIDQYQWDITSGTWGNATARFLYQYPSNSQTLTFGENFDAATGIWRTSSRTTIDYNNNDEITHYLLETQNAATQTFTPLRAYDISYNADGSKDTYKLYMLHNATQIYFQSQQVDYEYPLVSTQSISMPDVEVNVFPNPTTDHVQVRLTGSRGDKNISMTLFDSTGRPIASKSGASTLAIFSLAGQPTGVYTLRVEQNGAEKTIKILKIN